MQEEWPVCMILFPFVEQEVNKMTINMMFVFFMQFFKFPLKKTSKVSDGEVQK
jgi:hypothetical protein